ncbi:hypothetical protein CRE_19615 [Caenorhabditis remanei]|uniref:BTB domain-containing protein n=1 Tax=Caenorhabditis remanei TaxID=31234 RepID=E3NUK8_CAERE|nr:hypothetical protein CRE_19615 [Caenorhabditis remanei]
MEDYTCTRISEKISCIHPVVQQQTMSIRTKIKNRTQLWIFRLMFYRNMLHRVLRIVHLDICILLQRLHSEKLQVINFKNRNEPYKGTLFGTRLPRNDTKNPTNNEKAVTILPVSRNLAEHVSNLIAIGRKPVTVVQKKKPTNLPEENQGTRKVLGWQADKKTLRERINHMYCNETLADVFFVVGSDESRQRIPAHKFVLSIGSVVF